MTVAHAGADVGDTHEVQLLPKPGHAYEVDLPLQPQTVLEVVSSHIRCAEYLLLQAEGTSQTAGQ